MRKKETTCAQAGILRGKGREGREAGEGVSGNSFLIVLPEKCCHREND